MGFWTTGDDTTLHSQIPYSPFYTKSDEYPLAYSAEVSVSPNIRGIPQDSAPIQERQKTLICI